MFLVLAASAYLEMRRDVAAFNIDSRRDDVLIGKLFAFAMNEVWDREGRDRAISLVAEVLAHGSDTQRLRWIDAENLRFLPPDSIRVLRSGNEIGVEKHEPARGMLLVYTPLLRNGAMAGVLEISEPLANERRYAERIGLSTFITTIALAAISLLMTTLVGIWLVGRPIGELIRKARRVGSGDFTGPLAIGHRDEIGELATEMNLMSEHLAHVSQQVNEATTARIAALEQLRHADRLSTVGKLASGIAHELGTPLNVVSGRAQLILDSIRDHEPSGDALNIVSDVTDNARIIVEQTGRISTIIRQLLDFSRRRGANKTQCDLQQIIRQSVAMLDALSGKSGVTVLVRSDCANTFVNIDSSQIHQVLINILVNAIQSMPGGGRITISIGPSANEPPSSVNLASKERVAISVQDEGCGIADDVIPHIFEPFFTTKPLGSLRG